MVLYFYPGDDCQTGPGSGRQSRLSFLPDPKADLSQPGPSSGKQSISWQPAPKVDASKPGPSHRRQSSIIAWQPGPRGDAIQAGPSRGESSVSKQPGTQYRRDMRLTIPGGEELRGPQMRPLLWTCAMALYLLMGATMFQYIEAPLERKLEEHLHYLKVAFLKEHPCLSNVISISI
ncbi:uncharacterized protein LOC114356968 [Ostrinia furnacalis]|uniref:uncharacterized protein LOC114356968 n=1 Tax=Ostrinia furnacalis TaxID=93504 RepID=UPI00103F2611|nr:uncharacterized protein LOC114356968 [Ostrinia furnacalis]